MACLVLSCTSILAFLLATPARSKVLIAKTINNKRILFTGFLNTERLANPKKFMYYPSIFANISFGFARNIGRMEQHNATKITAPPKRNNIPISCICKTTFRFSVTVSEPVMTFCKTPENNLPMAVAPKTESVNTLPASNKVCRKISLFVLPRLIKIATSFCLVRIHIHNSRETTTVPVTNVSTSIRFATLLICSNGADIC